jgi:hypothetical protein
VASNGSAGVISAASGFCNTLSPNPVKLPIDVCSALFAIQKKQTRQQDAIK